MTDKPVSQVLSEADSIYTIIRRSPAFSWQEREAVNEADVEAALGAYVPGGARVLAWLPMTDGHHVHQTARDVMRAAIAAVDKRRAVEAERGLGPHALTFAEDNDVGFSPVFMLRGRLVFIRQGNAQVTMSADVADRLAAALAKEQGR